MRTVCIVLSSLLVSTSLACGGSDSGPSAGSAGSSAGGSAAAGGTGGAGQGGSSTGGQSQGGAAQGGAANALSASLSGKVTDRGGNPFAGGRVQLCFRACRSADVDSDGSYELPKAEAATHLMEIWPPSTASVWLAPTMPLTLAANKARTLDLTWLAADSKVPLPATATPVDIAPGIHVSIGKDNSTPSMYLTGDFTEVYGVRYPLDKLPKIEGASGTPVGVWVLGPTETAPVGDGFVVSFDNDQSLSDGTELTVWISEQDLKTHEGIWKSIGHVNASGDQLTGDAKLPTLGTVLLTK